MKKIPEPDLKSAVTLKPAELNKIHFGGNHTPLTPEQISQLAHGQEIDLKAMQPLSQNSN